MKKCVFAGTFDPPTVGHLAVVERAKKLFDEVVVAVMVNPVKSPCFSAEERMEMLSLMFGKDSAVKLRTFTGTAAELLKEENTEIYVRGIRNIADFEYENENYFSSAKLDKDILPVYLPCPQELLHVSSHMVKNSLLFSVPFDGYVTDEVGEYIKTVWQKRGKGNV